MTQEFEDWAENYQGNSGDVSLVSWQASREQLKAKLLSDEMVDVAAEGMFPPLSILGDEDLEKARNYAKAAIEAIVGEL